MGVVIITDMAQLCQYASRDVMFLQTQNTGELYNPERSLGTASQASAVPRVPNSREALALPSVPNTYLARYARYARYSPVAFVWCFGIDSTKASME